MRLFLRFHKSRSASIEISPYASIYSLKHLIFLNFRLPIADQTLFYNGRALLDFETFINVGIQEDHHVLVQARDPRFNLPSAPPGEGIGVQFHPSAPPLPPSQQNYDVENTYPPPSASQYAPPPPYKPQQQEEQQNPPPKYAPPPSGDTAPLLDPSDNRIEPTQYAPVQPNQYAPPPNQNAPQPDQYAPPPNQIAPQPNQIVPQPNQYGPPINFTPETNTSETSTINPQQLPPMQWEVPPAEPKYGKEGPSDGDGCYKAWQNSPHFKNIFLTIGIIVTALLKVGALIGLLDVEFIEGPYFFIVIGVLVLFYFCEIGFSSTQAYLSHSFVKEGCEEFVRQLRATRPALDWTMQCYHYETRVRHVTSTDKDGKTTTRTETYQERVNTHYASGLFQFKSFIDVSGEIRGLDEYKLTRIRLRKEWTAADPWTEQSYRCQKTDFISYNNRDMHYDFNETFRINGFTPRVLAEVEPGTKSEYMTPCWFWVASFALCSSCYRCWFSSKTGKKTFYIIKQLSIHDPREMGIC